MLKLSNVFVCICIISLSPLTRLLLYSKVLLPVFLPVPIFISIVVSLLDKAHSFKVTLSQEEQFFLWHSICFGIGSKAITVLNKKDNLFDQMPT